MAGLPEAGTTAPASALPPESGLPSWEGELQRALERRAAWGIRHPSDGEDDAPWALCLSGGGIRSATFCLGVLQGLSETPSPQDSMAANGELAEKADGQRSTAPASSPPDTAVGEGQVPLLAQFDFLSTVSGGGYIGSFFSSLFVRGRLSGDQDETALTAAQRAYRVFHEEPPGRMRTRMRYDPARPGAAALAWLRDNGRYLTPGGSGDLGYAAAISARNWAALQGVVSTVLLVVLALALAVHLALAAWTAHSWKAWVLGSSLGGSVLWSASWVAVAAVLGALAVPFGLAYWCAHPAQGEDLEGRARPFTEVWVCGMVVGCSGLASLGWVASSHATVTHWLWVLGVAGALLVLGGVFYTLTWWWGRPANVSAMRVLLSRMLMRSLMLACGVAALALVETLALTAVSVFKEASDLAAAGASSGVVSSVLVGLVRFLAARRKQPTAAETGKSLLPLDALALVVAVVLWLLLATLLDVFLLWVCWDCPWDLYRALQGACDSASLAQDAAWVAGGAALLSLILAALVGLFPGFINLSTYQPLYSARLTRAYLGASNHQRFCGSELKRRNVASPAQGDGLSVADLYANPLAPTHFINVCLNQTAGPEGELVQRDRKGKPLVVAPGGFYLDGEAHAIQVGSGDLGATLSVGEWVGVSGAAFSTGLGRSTSLGMSLLLGFANVRLGRWWPHGIQPKTGAQKTTLTRRWFKSQHYLFDEMTASFHGARMPYAYLSDGGHFENTAAYEMLRPQRRVKLLVVCDCGADGDYVFDDLANLVRLARIDHQIELKVNTQVVSDPNLKPVFTTPEALRRGADGKLPAPSTRCAVLLDAFHHDPASNNAPRLVARVIVIKPVVVSDVPVDVSYYAAKNPSYPQESTADQFFDEAQWESYRKLALQITRQLFPQGDDVAYARSFWESVQPQRQ